MSVDRSVNRVALVTGGSRGIGQPCEALARAGARVAVNYVATPAVPRSFVEEVRRAAARDGARRRRVGRRGRTGTRQSTVADASTSSSTTPGSGGGPGGAGDLAVDRTSVSTCAGPSRDGCGCAALEKTQGASSSSPPPRPKAARRDLGLRCDEGRPHLTEVARGGAGPRGIWVNCVAPVGQTDRRATRSRIRPPARDRGRIPLGRSRGPATSPGRYRSSSRNLPATCRARCSTSTAVAS